MTYAFAAAAARQLRKLPPRVQREIVSKIKFFLSTDRPLHFAEPIIGEMKTYRFRIGDYRTIFKVEQTNIVICKIGHRRDIYR
jgi:mRNA-degrading endonuclease RelE of RelBE toxin-antitoxin system